MPPADKDIPASAAHTPATGDDGLLQRIAGRRLAVLGDCMLDRFLWGRVDRVSPEAPVPVVRLERETATLGGAANVAANIRALGARVTLLAVCGQDEAATHLRRLLAEAGIEDDGLIEVDDRPTTVKTRIIAHSQQVVRADRERVDAVTAAITDQLVRRLVESGPFDGVVLSDYGKGVLTDLTLARAISHVRERGGVAVVDPKRGDYSQYYGATSLTPNQREAEQACGIDIEDRASLDTAGRMLLERTGSEAVLITRGEHGIAIYQRDGAAHHLPTEATEVFDVTGAGDTVVAVYTAALTAGADYMTAAALANRAAGVAVRELGTVAVTAAEILGERRRRTPEA
ncbi:MAG: D-glycero-beta-D-manno-heptose-7-phosphate kinase [Candidatus Krumholzibacteriia bacterium]